MATKTYVLLDSMDADAPVYQQLPDGTRSKVKKIPFYRPTLIQTFQDKEGVSRTIRYKSNSNYVFQDEQLKHEKLEANLPFSTAERADCLFRGGVRVVTKLITQKYLESHPAFAGFEGTCDDVSQPKYRLLDEVGEAKIKNSETKKRIKAANKIIDIEDLKVAQDLLIRLNGSFFKTPDDIELCQSMLIAFVDDAEEAGLDAVLKEEKDITVDEKTIVLIGSLMNAGLVSFDAVEGKISKKDKNGKWITLREMSSEYSVAERMRLFSDFLNTEDGKLLRTDLEKDLLLQNKNKKE